MKQVVCDLLDQLAKKDSPPPAAAADPAEESVEKVASTAAGIEDFPSPFSLHSVSLQQELVRNSSSNALLQHEVEDNQVLPYFNSFTYVLLKSLQVFKLDRLQISHRKFKLDIPCSEGFPALNSRCRVTGNLKEPGEPQN